MRRAAVIAISTFLVPQLALAESYLCVAEKSNGFSYNEQQQDWVPTQFSANREYLVRRPNEDDTLARPESYKWVVTEFDAPSSALGWCEQEINEQGGLYCEGFFGSFLLNSQSLRYVVQNIGGYLGGDATDNNAEFVEIGTCRRLD